MVALRFGMQGIVTTPRRYHWEPFMSSYMPGSFPLQGRGSGPCRREIRRVLPGPLQTRSRSYPFGDRARTGALTMLKNTPRAENFQDYFEGERVETNATGSAVHPRARAVAE